jgi:lipopolysaccharide transport system permease protein
MVFGIQWPNENGDTLSFAALLFAGLICHAFAAEVLLQASTIITSNQQYVKKVIFPLEILPWVVVLSALFHLVVSTGVLLVYVFIIQREMFWTALFIPLPFLALTFMMLSFAWLISSLAVFVRDVSQVVELGSMAMLFLSPVFFPLNVLPEQLQPFLYLNPITFIVEEVRGVLLFGRLPNIKGLVIYSGLAGVCCWLSLSCFQRLRRGFSDVM